MASESTRIKELVVSSIRGRGAVGQPSNFLFHPTLPRLYFLGREPTSSVQTLYHIDLTESENVQWKPAIVEQIKNHQMSREEQLLRERMRQTSIGITDYTFDEKTCQFLIPASGTLYTLDVTNHVESAALVLEEIKTTVSGARMDPKRCPNNPSLISFVRDGDLWLTDSKTSEEKRLTFSRKDPQDDSISSGVAEFIIQEEFDRFTGYWWHAQTGKPSAFIAYLEVDEKDVEVYSIPVATDIHGQVDKFRYPLAGAKNAVSSLCLLEIDPSSSLSSNTSKISRLTPSLHDRFPWAEYVVRCGWLDTQQHFWVQLLDRKQQRLEVVSFDIQQFNETNTEAKHEILFSEQTNYWINVTDLFYNFDDGRFIIASEVDTGYRHLYLISPATKTKKILTSGEWQVDNEFLKVDVERELIYFVGTKDSPIESHLYVTSYSEGSDGNVARLTGAGYKHDVVVSGKCDKFVTVYSNLKEAPKTAIYSLKFAEGNKQLPSTELLSVLNFSTAVVPQVEFPASPGELFTFTNSIGEKSYGIYYTPPDFDKTKSYPTVLYVYGGPHVQLVENSFTLTRSHKRWQLMASEGYVVAIMDGVGSWRRGLKWEAELQHKMGIVEIKDQILGLEHLIGQGLVDRNRIAVTGWSYGGYLSLSFLAQRPDFFKLAIAGGPVTEWEAYDTGYTERYMDTPQNNPAGYKAGSVLNQVNGFPDSPNRLLIVHGSMDENVHFCHTSKLISSLINAGKPYQLQIYPSERHGVRSFSGAIHWEVTSLVFIKNYL